MLGIILVCYGSILCSSMYLNIHIVMEMALLKGPLRMHMMIENKTPPKMTRTGRGMLCHCMCLLQSGTWERSKVETAPGRSIRYSLLELHKHAFVLENTWKQWKGTLGKAYSFSFLVMMQVIRLSLQPSSNIQALLQDSQVIRTSNISPIRIS